MTKLSIFNCDFFISIGAGLIRDYHEIIMKFIFWTEDFFTQKVAATLRRRLWLFLKLGYNALI